MCSIFLFYPKNASVPSHLKTEEFLIRPLRATDVDLDYKAVMESQEFLLIRSNGQWPRVGFTREENFVALESRTPFDVNLKLGLAIWTGCHSRFNFQVMVWTERAFHETYSIII